MVIAIFKPIFVCHCSDDPVSSLVSYHRVVPTFALSSGLRMWIKLIMSEANLMDNTNRTEFRVEVGREMHTSCTMFFPCMCHHTPLISKALFSSHERVFFVQINLPIYSLRYTVDGTASTGDVICRLFGTTITTLAIVQSPTQHVCTKSTNPRPQPVYSGPGSSG